MMANEIAYQEKFRIQLGNCDEDIRRENDKEKAIKIRIKQKKLNVEQLKGKFNKLCKVNQHIMGESDSVVDFEATFNTTSTNNSQSHMSLNQIKKYEGLMDSISSTLEANRSIFGQEMKSKDSTDYEVGMRMVEMKTESSFMKRKDRISLR